MNAAQDCRSPHASTLRIDPAGYEQHVLPFLDRSLPD